MLTLSQTLASQSHSFFLGLPLGVVLAMHPRRLRPRLPRMLPALPTPHDRLLLRRPRFRHPPRPGRPRLVGGRCVAVRAGARLGEEGEGQGD